VGDARRDETKEDGATKAMGKTLRSAELKAEAERYLLLHRMDKCHTTSTCRPGWVVARGRRLRAAE
jgi:hypothetical protein